MVSVGPIMKDSSIRMKSTGAIGKLLDQRALSRELTFLIKIASQRKYIVFYKQNTTQYTNVDGEH